jgi:hypothetical protein
MRRSAVRRQIRDESGVFTATIPDVFLQPPSLFPYLMDNRGYPRPIPARVNDRLRTPRPVLQLETAHRLQRRRPARTNSAPRNSPGVAPADRRNCFPPCAPPCPITARPTAVPPDWTIRSHPRPCTESMIRYSSPETSPWFQVITAKSGACTHHTRRARIGSDLSRSHCQAQLLRPTALVHITAPRSMQFSRSTLVTAERPGTLRIGQSAPKAPTLIRRHPFTCRLLVLRVATHLRREYEPHCHNLLSQGCQHGAEPERSTSSKRELRYPFLTPPLHDRQADTGTQPVRLVWS